MRIAVSGTAGTGKTTLSKLIASNNASLRFVPDLNDLVLREMGFQNGRQLYRERGQEGIIDWHIQAISRKIEHDVANDNYVTDKSVFDFGARSLARIYPEVSDVLGVDDEQHKIILRCLEKGARLYDRIIFMPLNLNRQVEDNTMRTTDPKQRYKFNVILLGLYGLFNVKIEPYDFRFSDSPEKALSELGLDRLRIR